MDGIRRAYGRLDDWVWGRSRGQYAVLTGVVAAFGGIAVTLALGDPNYAFAIGIGVTLLMLNYWFDPNHREG